jgi:hypothetical protein
LFSSFFLGSVDTNNNRRDNMLSFHDIMKTYRWENRFLSFTFGIAEANAFSCFKIWGSNAGDLLHSDFKSRLAFSLLEKVRELRNMNVDNSPASIITRKRASASAHAYTSLSNERKRVRLVCKSCAGRGVENAPRVEKRCACNMEAMCKTCHREHYATEYKKLMLI